MKLNNFFKRNIGRVRKLIALPLKPFVLEIVNRSIRVWGDKKRVYIHKTAEMVNTLFNTVSGSITVGEYTFTGHNVCLITGTHYYESLLKDRMKDVPLEGRDIVIGKGVWIGSNVVILGPCTIGDHAVIGASAVVLPNTNVPDGAVMAGVPAKMVKSISSHLKEIANN